MTVFVAWLSALAVVAGLEWTRIEDSGLLNLLVSWNPETTLPTLLLLAVPLLVVLFPQGKKSTRPQSRIDGGEVNEAEPVWRLSGSTANVFLQALLIAGLSLLSSWGIGRTEISVRNAIGEIQMMPFAELRPAYHDEYSYLLQAETFRAGKFAWPRAPVAPDAFHQFHVLNEDVTISRYFPLTGLWMAPFLTGEPTTPESAIRGQWLAGALAAVFFFLSARMLMPGAVALFCGLLLAISPGLAVFSNMLLAHHPVMLMLSVFLFAFLKLMRLPQDGPLGNRKVVVWGALAGLAMSAAMLGRPMTAAGFTLPFGIWLLFALIHGRVSRAVIPAFALPLLAGFSFLGVVNHAGTGSVFRTAYQEYTDTFTPRHKFGFGNADNCQEAAGPEAVKKYDRWATNLDKTAAAKNIGLRTKFSLFWIWNIVSLSLGMTAAAMAVLLCRTSPNDGLIGFDVSGLTALFASVLSLHVVHIPYWYAGIMEWHYVFETAPLILLLGGFGLIQFLHLLHTLTNSRLATVWLALLVLGTAIPAWISSPNVLGDSKVELWINQMAYSRRRMTEFDLAASQLAADKNVLILVDETNTDPQLSFIVNPPDYLGPVLVCRMPSTVDEFAQIKEQFNGRSLYYFDASQAPIQLVPFESAVHMPSLESAETE